MGSKLDYLQKYMSGGDKPKRKRRKKKATQNFRIHDDEDDWKPKVDDEFTEDGPQVVTEEELKAVELPPEPGTKLDQSKFKAIGESPPRRRRHDSDESDASPPRRRHDSDAEDESPPRRRHDSDAEDESPPRRRHDSDGDDASPPRRRAGSDASPPRRRRHDSDGDNSPPRRSRPDIGQDNSPPRNRAAASGDMSPPRRRQVDNDNSPPRRRTQEDSSPPRKKISGLQSAADLKKDAIRKRKIEQERLAKLAETSQGQDETVHRDKSGKRIDPKLERIKKREEQRKKDEEAEAQAKWGRGIQQVNDREEQLRREQYEMSKPFARYADDEDLVQHQKSKILKDDPMAEYMLRKQEVKMKRAGIKMKPKYKGPPPPPNRFGILPGHRWDGRDRSNGFEKKLFLKKSESKAWAEDAYKWSVENM